MTYGNFINGKWHDTDETFKVHNKYDGKIIAEIGKADEMTVNKAVENAEKTFFEKELSPIERYEILLKTAEIVQSRKDTISDIISSEVGKVKKESLLEVERTVQTLIASAEEAKRISGEEIPVNQQPGSENKLAFTVREPVGVIAAITPFNFPLNLTAHKLGPAIAAGNTVVLKPTKQTPLSACILTDIFFEAGLPAGFLNTVNGSGREVGEYLLANDKISMFTFTGSPEVGKRIKSKTGIKKITLELGNNSPNIIHNDVSNLQEIANLCVTKGFLNAGQACISVQRIYVHEDILDEFLTEAKNTAEQLVVGDPFSSEVDIGPMISEKEAIRAENWIREAQNEGAVVLTGG